jgi:D-tagatose-1,6-bisphosphate aldolase subunit GatZ/KbaZ
MENARDILINILQENRKGKLKGIYSVCSAQPDVIQASMVQALQDHGIALIEATSNQVDQFGGYTGMKPEDFVHFVNTIADHVSFPKNGILLGGDHLGPNPWKHLQAEAALAHARTLVYEYVKAGFQKIHLDASMFCADDQGDRTKPLDERIVSERASMLCESAEKAWADHHSHDPKPVYIIGTEVPIPGGAQDPEDAVRVTSAEDVDRTIHTARKAFEARGLFEAWERVYGLVVQPGVEYGDDQVFDYKREQAQALSKQIENYANMVYEAHSTDYQTEQNLKALIADHFCILKVGPWLTFAYREALFALEYIEQELLTIKGVARSNLKDVLEKVMLENDQYWKNYYHGDAAAQYFKRKYSFSDRSRYYWPHEELTKATYRLIKNLQTHTIPLSLLSAFMPNQYHAVREGQIRLEPKQLILHKIQEVLSIYSRSCGLSQKCP